MIINAKDAYELFVRIAATERNSYLQKIALNFNSIDVVMRVGLKAKELVN